MGGHVQTLGILMTVHGVVEILVAADLSVMTFVIPKALQGKIQDDPALQGEMLWFSTVLLGGMSLLFWASVWSEKLAA